MLCQPQPRCGNDLRAVATVLEVAEVRVAWMDCVSRVLHDACADAVANRARAHGNRGDCHEQV